MHYAICKYYKFNVDFKNPSNIYWLNLKNLLAVINTLNIAYSQFVIPLPVVHTISASGNLYILFWDYYIYGNKISKIQFKGVIIAFLGVLLTVNGRLILYYIDPTY